MNVTASLSEMLSQAPTPVPNVYTYVKYFISYLCGIYFEHCNCLILRGGTALFSYRFKLNALKKKS